MELQVMLMELRVVLMELQVALMELHLAQERWELKVLQELVQELELVQNLEPVQELIRREPVRLRQVQLPMRVRDKART